MTRTGAVFTTPWPLRINPHLDQARESAIAWIRRFGLLDGERAVADFVDWRLAEVAAFLYPDARAEDCCTAAQMMGWYFLPFDDQLDGETGRNPLRVATVCSALIGIVHGAAGPESQDAPTVRAFADLWGRMVRGMSVPLRSRVAFHWSAYFSSQLTEAVDRTTGFSYRDLKDYFRLRAATTCAFGQNDLGEAWGGTEVAPVLWHHPVLQHMRQLAADVVALRNDSMSLKHEDVAGGHNAIHLIQRLHGIARTEAVTEASRLAQAKVDEIVELEERDLPRLLRAVGERESTALRGYADILHNWIRGDYEWEGITSRHDEHRVMPDWASNLLVSLGS